MLLSPQALHIQEGHQKTLEEQREEGRLARNPGSEGRHSSDPSGVTFAPSVFDRGLEGPKPRSAKGTNKKEEGEEKEAPIKAGFI